MLNSRWTAAPLVAAIVILSLLAVTGCDTSSASADEDLFSVEAGASTGSSEAPATWTAMSFPGLPAPASEVRLPVLMYHHVGEAPPDASDLTRGLTVGTAQFEAQMAYLQQAGFTTVTQGQLYEAMYKGVPLPPRPVMLTFDDGFFDNYQVAAPILEKYGHRATFFIITGKAGVDGYMDWDQVRDLERRGMEIGSHTASHPDLTILDGAQLTDELTGAADILNEQLGHPVYWLCYPAGAFNKGVTEHAWAAGYQSAFTTMPGEIHHSSYSLVQPRWRVSPGTSMEEFAHLVE